MVKGVIAEAYGDFIQEDINLENYEESIQDVMEFFFRSYEVTIKIGGIDITIAFEWPEGGLIGFFNDIAFDILKIPITGDILLFRKDGIDLEIEKLKELIKNIPKNDLGKEI